MNMKLLPYLSLRYKALLTILLAVSATALHAQEAYPARAITMIIPLSAGSQVDALGRALADSISKQAGQPVVVINREGAGMVLGMDVVAKARPDGYTIAFGPDAPLSQTPHLRSNVPYKTSDFDLAGVGTPPHLLMEAVAAELGIKLNHIPFRSISDIAVQTMNGSVDFTVTVPNMLVVNAARGMQGLALTGDTRMTELPDVPLVRDFIDKTSPTASYGVGGLGIYAPKSLRPEAMNWLRKACKTATESTGFATASTNTLTPMNHAEGPDFLRNMLAASKVTEEIVRKLNLKLD
jgi:tripartite-type tricarboxylate transporter receptor subunit TctC